MTPPFHPVANLFPLLEGDAFEDLVNDVALHGVREPVWLHQGQVIDGRNRCRAHAKAIEREKAKPERISLVCSECERRHQKEDTEPPTVPTSRSQAGQSIPCPHCLKLLPSVCDKCEKEFAKLRNGAPSKCPHRPVMVEIPFTLARRTIPPLPTRDWSGEGSLVAFAMSLNLHRRHLNESQRAMLAARAAAMMEEEARQRQKAALKRGDTAPLVSIDTNGKTPGRTRENAAKLANVSPASVARANKVISEGTPQLAAAVDAGKVTVSRAAEFAKLAPEEQLARIQKEGERAGESVRKHDLKDAFDRWGSVVEKLRRQFEGHDQPVPKLVAWAQKGIDLLGDEFARLMGGRG